MLWINYKEYPTAIQWPGRINSLQFMFHYGLAYSTFAKQAKIHCSNLPETHQKTKTIKTSRKHNQVQHPIWQKLSS